MDSKAKDLSAIDKKVIGIIADGSKKLADIQAVYKQTNTILERSVGSEAVKRPPNIRIPREYDLDPSATPISNLQTIKNDFDSISRDFPTLTAIGVCPENYGDFTNLLKRCDEILSKIRKMPKEMLTLELRDKYEFLLPIRNYAETLIKGYEYQCDYELTSILDDFPTLVNNGVSSKNYGNFTNLVKRCDEILRKIEKMPKERLSKEFINKSKPLLTMKTYLVTLISSYEYQLHDKPFL